MKKAICILASIFLFLLISCDNDNDNGCSGVDCLPEATQTGANTFGALLDGEPFIPGGVSNPLDSQYQLINGERFFSLKGSTEDDMFNRISLSLLMLRN